MRNIISFLGLANQKLKKKEYQAIPEQLSFVVNATDQLNLLVDDILAFSKIDQADNVNSTVNLHDLMEDIAQSLLHFLEKNNAEIKFNNLPTIKANYQNLKMVFFNLVKNGIQYNDSPQPTIEITYRRTAEHHLFQIKDNGIGISEEYQTKVFEYFKRLHTFETHRGTGLGLGICRKIVQKMGGDLSLTSEVGKGSVFKVQLPKAAVNHSV